MLFCGILCLRAFVAELFLHSIIKMLKHLFGCDELLCIIELCCIVINLKIFYRPTAEAWTLIASFTPSDSITRSIAATVVDNSGTVVRSIPQNS